MSNLDRRIQNLENSTGNSERDSLIEQVISIWSTIGGEPTQLEAESIADEYLEQGITVLTWELVFRRDTAYNSWE